MLLLRRLLPVVVLAPLLFTTTGAAGTYPHVIAIPDNFQPEGIVAAGNTFYVGSLRGGDIYRGSLRTGTGSLFVDTEGRQALGMKVDRARGLLWVAGGFNGHAYVYDLRTGADVADFDFGGSLVNDVVVTRDAAFFTETFAPLLYKVPIARDGSFGAPETITVTGPAGAPTAANAFGLNGIDATPDGKTLLVNRSDFGALYTVDPTTGASRQIAISGGSLMAGTPDGLLRVGHDLWVVENFANRLTRVHVDEHWTSGVITARILDSAFEVPTTVTRHGSRLATVNGKFDLGFPPPAGPGAPLGTHFEVIQVRAP